MRGPALNDDDAGTARRARSALRWSQETIAIVAVGAPIITVGATRIARNIVTGVDLREKREEWQAESRALREAARGDRAEFNARFEAQREASERRFEVFQREILRLTKGQTERAARPRGPGATPP